MEKENKKSIAKMVACFVAGIAATKVAEVCGVLAICGLTAIMLIAFIVVNLKRGETFSRKGIITLVVMILALILIGFCHLSTHLQDEFEAVEPPKTSEIVKTHDQKPEDTTTVQDIQDNSGNAGAQTPVISNPRGYCSEDEKINASFSNVAGLDSSLQLQTTGSNSNTITASDNTQEEAKQDAEIEEEKEEGATIVEDTNTGITAGSSTKPIEEEKDESTKVDLDFDSAIGLESEGETTTPSEGNVKDESQNTLPEASSEEVSTPVEGGMTFEEEVEEEPIVEKVTPVGVTAIDGYEAYINSDIQFQISGDDVVIEGLDGIEYTFNDGILTINTGSDATVLTVSVSNSVSATSFDVVINGIVG